ncbi:hypothetical protein FGIG_02480 [Fasciola gigantica]|uniref:Uncharacterized protein n=1 Tax=Fasciola gigantica TaxID=46835 RepID=A0A504YK61_FASGI|nr:hypothetical protein FGIG_02480 [Fasciola gigantica]
MEDFNLNTLAESEMAPSIFDKPEIPSTHATRRKSSRRSILPCVCPVESTCESPRDKVTGLQITPASHPVSSSPTNPPPTNGFNHSSSSPTECMNSTDIVDRYLREIADWSALLQRFNSKLNRITNPADCLPSAQWIQEDRVITHYSEILLPILEDSEDGVNKTSTIPDNLLRLHRQMLFDLACLPDLLERQRGFLTGLCQSIQLDWSLERQTFEASHRTIDSIMEEFLSI